MYWYQSCENIRLAKMKVSLLLSLANFALAHGEPIRAAEHAGLRVRGQPSSNTLPTTSNNPGPSQSVSNAASSASSAEPNPTALPVFGAGPISTSISSNLKSSSTESKTHNKSALPSFSDAKSMSPTVTIGSSLPTISANGELQISSVFVQF